MVYHIILTDILLIARIFPRPFGARKNTTQLAKYPSVLYDKPSNKMSLMLIEHPVSVETEFRNIEEWVFAQILLMQLLYNRHHLHVSVLFSISLPCFIRHNRKIFAIPDFPWQIIHYHSTHVVIISFWMVLEICVTFLDAVFKWCCSVWSPLSICNSNTKWKFPERLEFCGSSSCGLLRAMLFLLPKIIVVNRDLRISQCLLIYCWRKLLICWSIGTDSLVIFLKKLSIAINEKLCISFPAGMCLVKRDMADVHSVSGVLYNLSSLFEFRPDWTPNKTHGKQNAPSRNLEYASHRNLFSQPLTKWCLEFEHSTDTGKSNSLPGFKHILCELELVLVRIQADFLEN